MSFDKSELKRLQKLSCIKLDETSENKFVEQMSNIIHFLDNLNQIDLSAMDKNLIPNQNTLRVLEGTKQYENIDKILNNVKHNKINNSIVIKSVLE